MRALLLAALTAILGTSHAVPQLIISTAPFDTALDSLSGLLTLQPARPADSLAALDRDIGNDILVDCGSDADILHTHYLHLDPPQPLRGHGLRITAEGVLDEELVAGTRVDVIAKLGAIKLLDKSFDFCEEVIGQVDMACPVAKGLQRVEKVIDIPNEVPPGRFWVQARVVTGDGRQVACFRGTVVIKM